MPVTIAAAPPPKARNARTSSAAEPGKLSKKATERAEGLNGIGQLMSAGLLFARQHADAGAIHRFWPTISTEAAKLGDDNPKLGEFLDSLTAVGPFAGLIAAVLPLGFQILVNHNRMDVTAVANMGVVSAETLKATVQADIMRMEMQAMQMQMEMERERAEMLREYQEMMEATQASREADNSPDAARNPEYAA